MLSHVKFYKLFIHAMFITSLFAAFSTASARGADSSEPAAIILPEGGSAYYFPIQPDMPAKQPDLRDPHLVASGFGLPPDSQFTAAGDDRENYDPTFWAVYEHQTTTDVINTANNNNYRAVDLFVETGTNPYQYTAVYVANTGSYAKSWWFLVATTPTDLLNFAVTNNARIVVQKAFNDPSPGGSVLFYTILISNTGADAKNWYFYKDQTIAQITSLWQSNNARLTQVNSYVRNSTTYYDVVMIGNAAADVRTWFWYVNATSAQLSANATNNNARVVDLDYDAATGNYNAIMNSCSNGCPRWWWYFGVSTADLLNTVLQNGARIIDVNVRPGCGDQCWDILLIDNSTTTIAGNTGVPGATLTYSNGGIQTITSDSAGYYSFTVPTNWSGTVTPSKVGYIFNPNKKSYSNVYSNQTNENYAASQIIGATLKSVAAQDGWILESSENSNAGGTMNSAGTTFNLGDDSQRKQYLSILSFDTGTSLPDNAVITSVTLKFKSAGIIGGGNPVATFGGFMADIQKGAFGTAALALTDFNASAQKTLGAFKPSLVGGWYSINLTNGKGYINKLGLTQIRLRLKLDDNNDPIANFLKIYSGNATAGNRPQLIVQYYVP
jgi:hypothetical protein